MVKKGNGNHKETVFCRPVILIRFFRKIRISW